MKWFKLKKPKSIEQDFTGKWLTVYPTIQDVKERSNGVRIQVEHIAGNLTHQTCFQINGAYLVSMLDAYSELNREPLPTQQMHEDFLSTVVEHVEREGKKLSLIDRNPNVQVH
jgi:hypothetical protein